MNKNKSVNIKISIVSVIFILSFCALLFRLFKLQVIDHKDLYSKSNRQYKREVHVKRERGIIYDRNMNILAASISADSVFVNPSEINDLEGTSKKLSKILGIEYKKVKKKLKRKKNFVWIKRKVRPSRVTQIKEYMKLKEIKGIGFIKEYKRVYPQKEFASSVVGFANVDGKGQAGLEYEFNKYIEGEEDVFLIEKDAKGRNIKYAKKFKNLRKGCDLVTTIDNVIQYITESELKKRVKELKAKSGIAIVMDSNNGDILALSNYPDFNPNRYNKYRQSDLLNRAVTYSYEPGSTFKAIVASSAIEEGIANPDDIFYCENGKFEIGGITIHDSKKYKWMTLKSILGKSSNIGTIKVALKLKEDMLYDYIGRFGFGKKSDIDLPGESRGILRPLKRWTGSSIGAIAIGHEISVTPVQLVTAFSAIANGGNLMKPRIVMGIEKNGKVIKEYKTIVREKVISNDTSRKVIDMLKYVVSDGTGIRSQIPGYSVAGKTGTAQKIDPVTRKYSNEKFVASFVGFLPADDPKITILVMIDEPKDKVYGGQASAPVFSQIGARVMRYLSIEKDNVKEGFKEA